MFSAIAGRDPSAVLEGAAVCLWATQRHPGGWDFLLCIRGTAWIHFHQAAGSRAIAMNLLVHFGHVLGAIGHRSPHDIPAEEPYSRHTVTLVGGDVTVPFASACELWHRTADDFGAWRNLMLLGMCS